MNRRIPAKKGQRGIPSPVGERILACMTLRGLTREDLAAKTYRTPQTISNLVLGRHRVYIELIGGLAEILGCNPAWLAFGIGESGMTTPINNEPPVNQTEGSTSAR